MITPNSKKQVELLAFFATLAAIVFLILFLASMRALQNATSDHAWMSAKIEYLQTKEASCRGYEPFQEEL